IRDLKALGKGDGRPLAEYLVRQQHHAPDDAKCLMGWLSLATAVVGFTDAANHIVQQVCVTEEVIDPFTGLILNLTEAQDDERAMEARMVQ
ncbi:hypothetical protein WDZ92_34725, partial [Nostoc sp. NIES-2111]